MSDLIDRQAAIDALKEYFSDEDRTDTEYGAYWHHKHVLDVLRKLPSAQQWIPCSERLPEPRMDVWACSDIGQIQGYYEEHVGIWYASFGQGRDYLELYVTAWMPLPEPYQEGKNE